MNKFADKAAPAPASTNSPIVTRKRHDKDSLKSESLNGDVSKGSKTRNGDDPTEKTISRTREVSDELATDLKAQPSDAKQNGALLPTTTENKSPENGAFPDDDGSQGVQSEDLCSTGADDTKVEVGLKVCFGSVSLC